MTKERAALSTYRLISTHRNMGQTIVAVKHDKIDSLSIDFNRKVVLWNDQPARFVRRDGDQAAFLVHRGLIEITGRRPSDQVVCINFKFAGSIVWDMLETRSGSAPAFYDDLDRLNLPTAYHGLVASEEYIDKTPVGTRLEFVGGLVVSDGGCTLNEKPCTTRRVQLANGTGAVVISNGTNDLTLSADGNWAFSEGGDSGKQSTGCDASLGKVYLAIRQAAK